MYFLLIYLFIPVVNNLVTVEIHRKSIYQPFSSCSFIRNISWSNDASIQSCTWECVQEYNCQTAVYYNDDKNCLLFADICQTNFIQSSGNISASVICFQKTHSDQYNVEKRCDIKYFIFLDTLITMCSTTMTTNQIDTESSYTSMMTTTEETSPSTTLTTTLTPINATMITTNPVINTTESSYVCGNMTVLIGTDLGSANLNFGQVHSFAECCTWCQSNSSCVSFTWDIPTGGGSISWCYLKNLILTPSSNPLVVSAHY
ncbi:unnamed protein product [Adineta steineri]|uniref:Apple domain-containing protein n=1 Tax=Adineta steineri TaxID=433720 RepID=A0A819CKM7_9BILA|nr:unnamed protein product [Adineta steineri]CAF3813903.1 unnamed protein product [Adineta steineri]CAF3925400.1 unnamed protein product [Adineta steineri]